jgi:hypothetical protein
LNTITYQRHPNLDFKNIKLPINGLGTGLVSTKINGLGTYCGGGLRIEKFAMKFEAPKKLIIMWTKDKKVISMDDKKFRINIIEKFNNAGLRYIFWNR